MLHVPGALEAPSMHRLLAALTVVGCATCFAQPQPQQTIEDFIRVQSPVIALEHVRVIDGTGAPAQADQTIVIVGGKIAAIGRAGAVVVPAEANRMDLSGYSALPGLVGMHDHLFYPAGGGAGGELYHTMVFSFPRLYLAGGVTTIRTTGALEPYTDLELKKAIDAGKMIGPKINVTGPYLEGEGLPLIQTHKLTGPDDARRTVEYWAAEGAGSFKAYNYLTRAELKAAIDAAHRLGLTLTGHLCSVGFREAAELGIDDLEHGLFVDTEFVPDKKPDVCPKPSYATAADMEINGEPIQTTIKVLVSHHVAVTSTLPVIEDLNADGPAPSKRVLDVMSEQARNTYLKERETTATKSREKDTKLAQAIQRWRKMFGKEMEFERAFVKAGGLLLAGIDPIAGVIPGFADQREVELLVEAGFSPLEAIKIASLNGAQFLKEDSRIGSLSAGKQADIMIVKGDPSTHIQDIENVDIVFKDGIGYDSQKLIESVKGQVGTR
jgi:imidazolonepropionase-like amidohydrolase